MFRGQKAWKLEWQISLLTAARTRRKFAHRDTETINRSDEERSTWEPTATFVQVIDQIKQRIRHNRRTRNTRISSECTLSKNRGK
jgi:hypothetical protein